MLNAMWQEGFSNCPQGSYRVVLVDRFGSIYATNGTVIDLSQGSAGGSVGGDVLASTWSIGDAAE